MPKGVKKITQPQVIAAHKLLTEHLETVVAQTYTADGRIDQIGHVTYKNGMDDEALAILIGASTSAIAGIRNKMFGQVKRPSVDNWDLIDTLDLEVRQLQAQNKDLHLANTHITTQLQALTDRFNRLVETLAVNQVAPVRHLATTAVVKAA